MTQTTDPIAGDPRFPWEPPLAGTELEHLLGMLNRLRFTFRWKASGLDAEGLNKRLGPSELTLGGLLKHLASVEALKFTWEAFRTDPGEPWRSADWSSGDDWVFASAADDSPDQLYALYDESVTNARRVIDKAIADGGIDQLIEMGDDQGQPSARGLRRHRRVRTAHRPRRPAARERGRPGGRRSARGLAPLTQLLSTGATSGSRQARPAAVSAVQRTELPP